MDVRFMPNRIVQIDDARIIWKNFEGRGDKFNREGDRNFTLVIPTEEIKDALINDVNSDGAGWNVKVMTPRDPDETPLMHLKVKVKFNGRGPKVRLVTNGRSVLLDEGSIGCLDYADIRRVDLDIRPYDDIISGKPFRAAYLHAMRVVQEVDRFDERFAEEEYPEE